MEGQFKSSVGNDSCTPCAAGETTTLPGATSASECRCESPGPFTNCGLNELLVEHAPHSVYVAEAWGSGTLPDLSGNGRHAVLMVVPLYWQTEQALGG